ncbi:MAG: M67 family metallopeptidase [Gammaproteobacteria bacterium]|nr:M67 family metallopeptidase [Gammaproteobacteria bacterium]
MTETQIKIERPLAIHLLTLAQQSPDREICGLIGATHQQPGTIYPTTNISKIPQTEFEMDAQDQISALKKMRKNREHLFAIYHSHPSAAATPSARDLENIGYPDAFQIIISLNTKGVLEMRAYKLGTNGFEEVSLVV